MTNLKMYRERSTRSNQFQRRIIFIQRFLARQKKRIDTGRKNPRVTQQERFRRSKNLLRLKQVKVFYHRKALSRQTKNKTTSLR